MATIRAGAATDVGKIRRRNEDSALVGEGVWAVADGMGGHAAGDVASDLAVTALRRLDEVRDRDPFDVRDALTRANDDILAAAVEDPSLGGMGTTVTGLSLVTVEGEERWVVFNIGDSRVYRFVGGDLEQLTVDHVAPEALTQRRGVITRALGTIPGPKPDLWVLPAVPGVRYLICSDGLSLELGDRDIAAVLAEQADPVQAAEELVRRAVVAGGRDNVTVVVVDHVAA
ncbi:protein phosphatase 2C domain-containing protein [Dactylosporangium fulvum]|uniref:Protein phosphatase 2C domain-containing protein n=1 Tax=Dactylosporangium fulvum TaxID=53359 RepID=A0ABY5VV59_9ACTN|nr:protein phosphatase 2C domain-containing protein [Dactylosporangium fulvum]UWP80944.1 protein phosphatase 2C domain-containing protein [Dactylosporangium fulvum]